MIWFCIWYTAAFSLLPSPSHGQTITKFPHCMSECPRSSNDLFALNCIVRSTLFAPCSPVWWIEPNSHLECKKASAYTLIRAHAHCTCAVCTGTRYHFYSLSQTMKKIRNGSNTKNNLKDWSYIHAYFCFGKYMLLLCVVSSPVNLIIYYLNGYDTPW